MRDAVQAELAANGYAGLTVEAVAERSGVHRTTVYRRWGGVDGLIVDALALTGEDDWRAPDTGTLDGDLRALTEELVAVFTDPETGPSSSAFVAAAFHSTRAREALTEVFADRLRRSEAIVARAVERGELAADIDAGAVVRAAVAPLYYRYFITAEEVDGRTAAQSAAAIAHAARAGLFSRPQ